MSKRTPLYDIHIKFGARMIDFNGWSMPISYSGIIEEHKTVRAAAGIFDLCHMARIRVPLDKMKQLQYTTTNDIESLSTARACYSLVCDKKGGIIDDILVYKLEKEFLVVANAGNRHSVIQALGKCNVSDLNQKKGMIAVQGPKSEEILCDFLKEDISSLKNYCAAFFSASGHDVMVSRTGYTGEDGFELYFDQEHSQFFWKALISIGDAFGMQPAGLGARNTLRLEAGMPLYGHELDLSVNPFEAGLGKFVCLDKPFSGRDALIKYKGEKPAKKLRGLVSTQKAIPRQGHKVFCNGQDAGEITSGSYSPSLDKSIALTYIHQQFCGGEKEFQVQIRKREVPFRLIELPFIKRRKKDVSEGN